MDQPQNILHVLPPYGHPDVCQDYDADCLVMAQSTRVLCFQYDPHPSGVCPFVD